MPTKLPPAKLPIDLRANLVDLTSYRIDDRTRDAQPDALVLHTAYAFAHGVYINGRITDMSAAEYSAFENKHPNDTVSKFGQVYVAGMPLLIQKKLGDVLIDAAISMRNSYGYFTVVMDCLRTMDSGTLMQERRPDLVTLGMLARAGDSAHNRAYAVDSKLFECIHPEKPPILSNLREVDEHGHLDDMNMIENSRFFQGISETAHANRLLRIQAWQHAAVKNKIAIANLLSEFWDDRVTGAPCDMWRVLVCRALCIGVDANPKTNTLVLNLRDKMNALNNRYIEESLPQADYIDQCHTLLCSTWNAIFTSHHKQQLDVVLGDGASTVPAKSDFIFHEWLEDIYDIDLKEAGFPAQCITPLSLSKKA